MTQQELDEILKLHKKWLFGEEGGQRANLMYADLTSANLMYADLRYADLTSANLTSANLTYANLTYANLMYANLRSANLTSANLMYADLRYADLTSADLTSANLTSANLTSANLMYADLRYADLTSANLTYANLRYADLTSADLTSANLTSANLTSAKNVPFIPYACPDVGSFIGYKKASDNLIVELEILSDAKRVSATGRKCRCDKAKVLSIQNLDGTISDRTSVTSNYDSEFIYTVGEVVKVDAFDEDRWNECSTGIHFFINRQEAVNYES